MEQAHDSASARGRWLVLAGKERVQLDKLLALEPDGVLLSPSMPGGARAYLRRSLATHAVRVHDLREHGAYLLRK